jgi:hypothetical protein
MSTLMIDELTLDVVGMPSWSIDPLRGFIAARVRLPGSVLTTELDRTSAHVTLKLSDGGQIEGHGMWRVGRLSTDGHSVSLRFEGGDGVTAMH